VNRFTKILSATVASGLVAVLPAMAVAAPVGGHARHHKAHSAGSGAPPVLPSIVRVRVERGTAALARAGDYVDQDLPNQAVASLLNARRNMYAAWRGAKYVIDHQPPPPPAAAARVHRSKAHASGAPVAGTAYADPAMTAGAVLGYQHTVATAAFGLLDGAKGALRDSVSTTMFAALNRRDSVIAYMTTLPPPDPTADAPVDYGAAAQAIVPDLDDELQQIEGLVSGGALTTGEKRIMNQADFQVFRTERTINTFWPPAAAG
jgi:hypothetical protein